MTVRHTQLSHHHATNLSVGCSSDEQVALDSIAVNVKSKTPRGCLICTENNVEHSIVGQLGADPLSFELAGEGGRRIQGGAGHMMACPPDAFITGVHRRQLPKPYQSASQAANQCSHLMHDQREGRQSAVKQHSSPAVLLLPIGCDFAVNRQ